MHWGEFDSFDAVITKYDVQPTGMTLMARIVRGADTDQKGLEPESFGLEAMADGFREVTADDHERLRLEFPMYDALTLTARRKPAQAERSPPTDVTAIRTKTLSMSEDGSTLIRENRPDLAATGQPRSDHGPGCSF